MARERALLAGHVPYRPIRIGPTPVGSCSPIRSTTAVLVPITEYGALEETDEILSYSETLAAIDAGFAKIAREESVTLQEPRTELDGRPTPD